MPYAVIVGTLTRVDSLLDVNKLSTRISMPVILSCQVPLTTFSVAGLARHETRSPS
jgi:hypothetical protein